MNHFNQLSPAEAERLALLAEELGECTQAIGKILRHGYESRPPNGGPTNREALEKEVADVLLATKLLLTAGDMDQIRVTTHECMKAKVVRQYLHHQPTKGA